MKDLCLTDESFLQLKSLILHENLHQLKKFGVQDHVSSMWLAITTEELGELSEAIIEFSLNNGSAESVVREAIQVATCCLKIAEMFQSLLKIRGIAYQQNTIE